MRIAAMILMLSAALTTTGCNWLKSRWPWRKDVPVTPSLTTSPPDGPTTRPTTTQNDPGGRDDPPLAYPKPPDDWRTERPRPATRPAGRQTLAEPVVVAGSMMRVNERFITVKDVLSTAHRDLSAIPVGLSRPAFSRQAEPIIARETDYHFQRALVLPEAKRWLPEEHGAFVDRRVAQARRKMIASAGGSLTRLQQDLAKDGIGLDERLESERRRIVIDLYLQARFMPSVSVNRRTLWNYYRKNRSQYTTAKRVRMQIIAAPVRAFHPKGVRTPSDVELQAARAEAKKLIGQALGRLEKGEDFAKVASELSKGPMASDGGRWPAMKAGSFKIKPVEQAAFQLDQGSRGGVIDTPSGFYIVRAFRVMPGKTTSFEEAQEDIIEKLRQEQFHQRVNAHFAALQKKATIIPSKELRRLALHRAIQEYWRPKP